MATVTKAKAHDKWLADRKARELEAKETTGGKNLKIYSVWDANNRLSKFYSSVEQAQLAMEELAQFYRNPFYNEDFRIVTDYVYDFVYEQED